jgi:hypothetical protein
MKRSRRLVFTLTFAVLASACSTGAGRYAGTLPGSRFHEMKRFYVQKASEDDRGLHEIIRDEMVRIGIDADAGEGEPAGEYDAVVTYIDRWSWDVTTFCMQLTIYVRGSRARRMQHDAAGEWHAGFKARSLANPSLSPHATCRGRRAR